MTRTKPEFKLYGMLYRFLAVSLLFSGGAFGGQSAGTTGLEEGFINPPPEARPWTLWQWMNGNISKEGITADLEAFKAAGLGGAQSFHLDYGLPQGDVQFMSPEWLDLYLFAAQEADRLGIKLGTHNCGGWSSSGGPWTRPENSMQMVVTREVRASGPSRFDSELPLPDVSYLDPEYENTYRDIAVLAYPTPANELVSMSAASPAVSVTEGAGAKVPQLKGDLLTSLSLPAFKADKPGCLKITFPEPFTARELILTPEVKEPGFKGVLEVSKDGETFTKVISFALADQPHRESFPNQQTFIFPPVSGRVFRIAPEKGASSAKPVRIAEIGLSGRQGIDNLPGKAFYQRHSILSKTGKKAVPGETEDGAVAKTGIVNLSGKVDGKGRLQWDVPPGQWTIVRVGYQPNGMKNHPAPLGGEGLECDKLSKEATDAHWAGMMGRLVEKFGPLAGKSMTKVEIDSWEVGTQNWTPKFREEFARRRGYDLTGFLPVFAGQVVDSSEVTERFLWDFRRTIADLFAENYAGRLRELANQHGMELAVENYGTGPFDDLQYGGAVDIPMGVHWVHNGSPQGCTLMAASAAHIYGRRIIGSEAFTAGEGGGNRWETDPYALKRLGDLMYCAGVNRFIFHAATHQRWPGRLPGLTFGKVGTQFSPTLTWWDNAGYAWFAYLSRCQWLLQQGLPAADVLVLSKEEAPPPTYGGSSFPAVPQGYDFDLCSADAFLNRLSVKDGRLVMPDGISYRVLVLPNERSMTLPVLRKIKELAAGGATIIGTRPAGSSGYTGYPDSDSEVRKLADQLWSPGLDAKGRGISSQSLPAALSALNLKPDFEARGNKLQVVFKHRTASDAEIYFVSNQKYYADAFDAVFRVSGRIPELFNPETGTFENAPVYREEDGRTVVPLRLESAGSVFVVFRKPAQNHFVSARVTAEKPVPEQTLEILKANYGVFDPKGNPRVLDLTGSRAGGIKRIMTPERFAGRDPAPGAPKQMLVQYSVDGKVESQAVPEDSVLELPQLPDQFKTLKVLYGELTAQPSAADKVIDVTDELNRRVENGSLSVKVEAGLSGAAALPAGSRELRVEYLYNGRRNVAYLPEGNVLELPGAYEAEAASAAYRLINKGSGVELNAWVPGRYEFIPADGNPVRVEVKNIPPVQTITGPWHLSFPPNLGAPAQIEMDSLISWTESADSGVKYFSGTATYSKEIDIPGELVNSGTLLELDLGAVKNVAQVILNGKNLGVLWKPPFRVNISGAAHAGKNQLEVKVTNLWPNRLIGDENLPSDRQWTATGNLAAWPDWVLEGKPSPTGRITFTTARHWKKDDRLLTSGLLGPVRLIPAKKQTLAVK